MDDLENFIKGFFIGLMDMLFINDFGATSVMLPNPDLFQGKNYTDAMRVRSLMMAMVHSQYQCNDTIADGIADMWALKSVAWEDEMARLAAESVKAGSRIRVYDDIAHRWVSDDFNSLVSSDLLFTVHYQDQRKFLAMLMWQVVGEQQEIIVSQSAHAALTVWPSKRFEKKVLQYMA
jgi:hypothetical protein